jgi:hypothetical protein
MCFMQKGDGLGWLELEDGEQSIGMLWLNDLE